MQGANPTASSSSSTPDHAYRQQLTAPTHPAEHKPHSATVQPPCNHTPLTEPNQICGGRMLVFAGPARWFTAGYITP